jgi:hypothetical protein
MTAEAIPLLARIDRLLGAVGGKARTAPGAASGHYTSPVAPDDLEDLFAFWNACHSYRPAAYRPNYQGFVLTGVFVCTLSAATFSMVTPYQPSVSQITDFFATSVPGYDQYQGVPVLERALPQADLSGIRAGGFVFRPTVETGFGYDDNVLGGRGSPASVISRSSPALAVNSDWGRNALGAYLSADTAQYLNAPQQSRTDWNAAIGGTYTIGRGELTGAYSHLVLHEDSTYVNAIPTSTPLPFTVDDVRANYTIKLGRFTLTPNIDLSSWRFGTATIGGQAVDERIEDHDVLQGGVAVGYELSGRSSLLGTVSVFDARYLYGQPRTPAPSAVSTLGMGGIDYRLSGNLRFRVLVGAESREFQSSFYRSRVAPVGQATAIWTPTGLTTITATVARTLEDAVQADSGGYTYTRAEFEIDHELLRNVVLSSRIGIQDSQALQPGIGTQTTVYGGVGATWRINRTLSLLLSYQYSSQSRTNVQNQATTNGVTTLGAYNRNVVDVRLHAAL